jgi:hypothetical protein
MSHNCKINGPVDLPCRDLPDEPPSGGTLKQVPIDSIDHSPLGGLGSSVKSPVSGFGDKP